MKTPVILLVFTIAAASLPAQIVNDGATNTLSNVTTNFTGDVTVGTNGSFTLLVLSDNALVTNSANGVIGLNTTAKSNEVQLLSASARWRMGGSLFVGSNGAMNRLVVSNGALLEDFNGTLSFRAASSNNFALVTGGGSLWTNRGDVTIGNLGAGNQLIVSNGGWVADKYGYVSRAASSSNNFALVTGSGSVWSNQIDLYLGFGGRSNRLVIEAGGLVTCDNGYLGDLGGSNSEALVTGADSVWSNLTRLVVGNNSTVGHRLTVSNGAVVWCGALSGFGSSGTGGTNNQVVVTGAGSLWTNRGDWIAAGTANRVDVNNGGWLADVNGYMVGSNTVTATGSGSGWNSSGDLQIGYFGDGSTLIASSGATVLSSNAMIGASTSLGNNNSALLTGAGTLWSNRFDFTVGNYSSGNQLSMGNGATVFTGGNGVVGANSGAINNSALVLNAGTRWLVGSNLYLGSNGGFNELVVSDGALAVSEGAVLGVGASSINNFAQVAGAGSVWSNCASALIVGQSGNGNLLVVNAGGRVESVGAFIGLNSSGSNNQATVTDAGSVWRSSGIFDLGEQGNANRFAVIGGGQVLNGLAYIGFGGSDNQAVVAEAGSSWINSSSLTVGYFGSRNALVVTNAGQVSADGVVIGSQSSSTNNRVTVVGGVLRATNVTGTAQLDVRRGTNVLNAGLIEADQLRLTNAQGFFEFKGGTLVTRGAVISNGAPFIVGTFGVNPAIWDVRAGVSNHVLSGNLVVGNDSSFNQLIITNGALLTNTGAGTIGLDPGARSNAAFVAGAGSQWRASDELFVGSIGASNQLAVENGGVVADNIGYVGLADASSNNTAVVTGSGSLWSNAGALFIGFAGVGNQLIVSDGGVVRSDSAVLGNFWYANQLVVTNGGTVFTELNMLVGGNNGGNSNTAIVTGAGSGWLGGANSSVFVGSNGALNRLVISNGATVKNFSAIIGFALPTSAGSNEVLVTGAGTLWSNSASLSVGWNSGANRLVISNGAVVCSSVGTICASLSSNNLVVVTDPGSAWTNQSTLNVGYNSGSFNRLVVTNSGVVDSGDSTIGVGLFATNCEALVTGAGSLWRNRTNLTVGVSDGNNRLVVTNGGATIALGQLVLGQQPSSTNNRITVDGGLLLTTNAGHTGALDIRRGTNRFNAGLIEADRLLLTSAQGFFEFNGGTLSVKSSTVSNGVPFRVGNGISPATLVLAGNGLHQLSSLLLHVVSSNATLMGNGTISGLVQFAAGSQLVPGTFIGKMVFSNSPALQGATIMEISKNGSTLTNDQVQVIAPLTYGGSLVVSNLGPTALGIGDRFPLFSANSYSGAFSVISLPSLPAGLNWTNKLVVDGSIEVVAGPKFTSVTLSGTNLFFTGTGGTPNSSYAVLIATNIALPLSNWVSIVTNQFDSGGGFSFTNGIAPNEPSRFFRIRTP